MGHLGFECPCKWSGKAYSFAEDTSKIKALSVLVEHCPTKPSTAQPSGIPAAVAGKGAVVTKNSFTVLQESEPEPPCMICGRPSEHRICDTCGDGELPSLANAEEEKDAL